MFDEPSSYLDVKQRLKVSHIIRDLIEDEITKYVIVVEHDLSICDYLSDYICVLYGVPGAYGVVTMPFSCKEGINIFLKGYIPTENMQFRNFELNFKVSDTLEGIEHDKRSGYKYPLLFKQLGDFKLKIEPGAFHSSEIIVLLGENGTGKTTFVRMLAGKDKETRKKVPEMNVSFKPQTISPSYQGSVRDLLHHKLKGRENNSLF